MMNVDTYLNFINTKATTEYCYAEINRIIEELDKLENKLLKELDEG